jgi:hypothetical protein
VAYSVIASRFGFPDVISTGIKISIPRYHSTGRGRGSCPLGKGHRSVNLLVWPTKGSPPPPSLRIDSKIPVHPLSQSPWLPPCLLSASCRRLVPVFSMIFYWFKQTGIVLILWNDSHAKRRRRDFQTINTAGKYNFFRILILFHQLLITFRQLIFLFIGLRCEL